MPTQTTTSPTIIASWGEVKQKLYFQDREIVNDKKSIVPSDKAEKLQYTTKDGVAKTLWFADEVTVLDNSGVRLKQQAERDLFRRYMKHEISTDEFNNAIAELNA